MSLRSNSQKKTKTRNDKSNPNGSSWSKNAEAGRNRIDFINGDSQSGILKEMQGINLEM